ncbi:MAG TPA: NADH-quinone oxidoreductase subunit I [Elusimicrobia bacterium]|nr:MAG: hypothetical protein A2278_05555 [Elusimicrobia bacterium RIFOXYA12_FULL_49_49]OGS09561.1 MAG: hypothetical protein A2204_06385 [Elusimicrobia bacterium RIFOXYA1_FULL_47_7]OGS14884.1 MAG: hypothetical protein A2251_04925 [Elusimicrobia bacterium RIFOXYA2_FULL_47_53]OGS26485.1 MAG: hypothetical protein A2339_05260 [Elusimicrobia bacterium RIFOXYB12_FULL_50_12]OGS29852.1 MAG: hypothetical protein A2323_06625 [Elusimicrobia bacterium RIFOXYB2_FULL_46_23]HBU69011.1 NADH-quinone oxidoreduct
MIRIIKEIYKALISLPAGMLVTLKYLFGRTVTMQYPEERWILPERFRGRVVLIRDEKTLKHRCTACGNCLRACPNASLRLESAVDQNKKRYPVKFTVDTALCLFCGLCVDSCPFNALKMNKDYELAAASREACVRSLFPDGENDDR